MENQNLIYGRNAVMEAIKSGREIDKLMVRKDGEGSIKKIEAMAREKKIVTQYVEKSALDRAAGPGNNHQGVVAYIPAHNYCELEDILAAAYAKGEDPFLIVLDGIEDPHNLGAIIRTADGAGAHGVIIPKRRAVGLTDTVAKASAGAIEYVPVARVANIAQTIEQLKANGIWVCGSHMEGKSLWESDLKGPVALVIGGEGQGVSRLVLDLCDFHFSIPMQGSVNSLNASNAAAILMYEVVRQRGVKTESFF